MVTHPILSQIPGRINHIKEIIKRKGWDLKQDLILERPATLTEVEEVEKQLGFKLPPHYRTLFTECASKLEFRYQMNSDLPGEFRKIFSGEIYWDLGRLPQMYEDYLNWVEASLNPKMNDPEAIEITQKNWKGRIPFMEVPDGDLILIGSNPSEVVFLSHEGEKMHGKILANNLFEFLEFHAKTGFIGSEGWQFEPFYNFETNEMETSGPKVDRFVKWLEG